MGQFCCYHHSIMRLVVVSVLVLLACAAYVSAQAGAPEIRRVNILDLLNEHPELKETLQAEIHQERKSKAVVSPAAKPRRPSLSPPSTTTTSPVPQADAPAAQPAPTTPK